MIIDGFKNLKLTECLKFRGWKCFTSKLAIILIRVKNGTGYNEALVVIQITKVHASLITSTQNK